MQPLQATRGMEEGRAILVPHPRPLQRGLCAVDRGAGPRAVVGVLVSAKAGAPCRLPRTRACRRRGQVPSVVIQPRHGLTRGQPPKRAHSWRNET